LGWRLLDRGECIYEIISTIEKVLFVYRNVKNIINENNKMYHLLLRRLNSYVNFRKNAVYGRIGAIRCHSLFAGAITQLNIFRLFCGIVVIGSFKVEKKKIFLFIRGMPEELPILILCIKHNISIGKAHFFLRTFVLKGSHVF
jgi:hypothetical protein